MLSLYSKSYESAGRVNVTGMFQRFSPYMQENKKVFPWFSEISKDG